MNRPVRATVLVEALCPQCGLCCNGAIFADVKLRPAERPRVGSALAAASSGATAGPVRAPGKAIGQPCVAFDGRLCRIYADRPQYCHAFECALLKEAIAGRQTTEAALSVIRLARRRADSVHRLLRALGDQDESAPLAARFGRVVKHLEAAPHGKRTTRLFGQLTLAMHDLNQVLARRFYPGS